MHTINGFTLDFDTWILISSMLASGRSLRIIETLFIYRVPNIESHAPTRSISIFPFKGISRDAGLAIILNRAVSLIASNINRPGQHIDPKLVDMLKKTGQVYRSYSKSSG